MTLFRTSNSRVIKNLFRESYPEENDLDSMLIRPSVDFSSHQPGNNIQDTEEVIEESLSLSDKEMEMIKKAS